VEVIESQECLVSTSLMLTSMLSETNRATNRYVKLRHTPCVRYNKMVGDSRIKTQLRR